MLYLLYLILIFIWLLFSAYLLYKGLRLSLDRIQEALQAYKEFKEAEKRLKEILKCKN